MAQLIRPIQPPARTVSQLLPTVKCSNCNNEVALQELGDHVCQRPPPVPTLPKLSTLANSVNAFLPTRLQSRSPGVPNTPIKQPTSPPRLFDGPNRRNNSPAPRINISQPRLETPESRETDMIYNTARQRTPEPRMNVPQSRNNIPPPRNYIPQPQINNPGLSPRPDHGAYQRAPSPLSPTRTSEDTIRGPQRPAPQNRDQRQQAPLYSTPQIPPPIQEPDTKIGGEAGMAGVGRRGFAAAARAAMLATNAFGGDGGYDNYDRGYRPENGRGMGPRRENAPRLDINLATMSSSRGPTPSLSPASGNSSRSSPFPHSPQDGRGNRSPSSPNGPSRFLDRIGNRPPRENIVPHANAQNTTTNMNTNKFMNTNNSRMEDRPRPVPSPFSSDSGSDFTPSISIAPLPKTDATPLSPGLESEFGGLPYAVSSYSDSDGGMERRVISPPPAPTSILRSPNSPPTNNRSRSIRFPNDIPGKDKDRTPVKQTTLDTSSSGSTIYFGHGRSTSEVSVSVSNYSHATALDGAMRKIFDDDSGTASSRSTSTSSKYKSARRRGMPKLSDQTKGAKLPTRAQTSPSSSPIPSSKPLPSPIREEAVVKKEKVEKKPKVCVKCQKQIEDGKWVQMDGGRVLCEKCWKNMYLPKCRRCNLPIEKQAVSSSDGQLKGKYHRACFNCNTCHKPFPDKSFYVFDGKPLCAYHYHEANDSLCAAATCGQPIEGPCALSHAGDRYHPQHLLCEYPGHPKCMEKLDEYYEVDGRMLCERHANAAGRRDEDEDYDDDERWRSIKATKRRTKFMNLGEVSELR